MTSFHIISNVPSSKNTGYIVPVRTKRARWNADPSAKFGHIVKGSEAGQFKSKQALVPGKLTRNYKKNTNLQWVAYANRFRQAVEVQGKKPARISFKFIRDTHRKFDYINALQLVQDQMVFHGWIDDDNADELLPVFEQYEVDKNNAGVIITIIG